MNVSGVNKAQVKIADSVSSILGKDVRGQVDKVAEPLQKLFGDSLEIKFSGVDAVSQGKYLSIELTKTFPKSKPKTIFGRLAEWLGWKFAPKKVVDNDFIYVKEITTKSILEKAEDIFCGAKIQYAIRNQAKK